MAEAFIGQITAFGFNFAPRSWSTCEGQLISISQNTALFSLLGTMYGGDGRTTFQLPNLAGRNPMGQGAGPGLTLRTVGQFFGREQLTMTLNEMPAHSHTSSFSPTGTSEFKAATDTATAPVAAEGDYLASQEARGGQSVFIPAANVTGSVNLGGVTGGGGTVTVDTAGASQPVNVLNPTLVLNFCIALQGIFPSRN